MRRGNLSLPNLRSVVVHSLMQTRKAHKGHVWKGNAVLAWRQMRDNVITVHNTIAEREHDLSSLHAAKRCELTLIS